MSSQKKFPANLLTWKLWKRMILIFTAVVIVLGMTAYFSRGWIGGKLQEVLNTQLARKGVHADYETTGFHLFRGLVVSDVVLYRSKGGNQRLATLSELAVSYDPFKLLFGKTKGVNLSTSGATLSLYEGGNPYSLEDLDSSIHLEPESIEIEKLDGVFQGLHLEVSADIDLARLRKGVRKEVAEAKEKDEVEELAKKNWAEDTDLQIIGVIAQALKLKAEGETPPTLEMNVALTDAGDLQLWGEFRGKNFHWNNARIDSALATYEWIEQDDQSSVVFKEVGIVYRGKKIQAQGVYNVAPNEIIISQLNSEADLLSLIAESQGGQPSGSVRFSTPPALTASGLLTLDRLKNSRLDGELRGQGAFEVVFSDDKILRFDDPQSSFKLSGGALRLTGLGARVWGGVLSGDVTVFPFESPVRIDGRLEADGMSLAQAADFAGAGSDRNGVVSGKFRGQGPFDLERLSGAGELHVTEADFVSVPFFKELVPLLTALGGGNVDPGKKDSRVDASYTLRDGILRTDDAVLETEILAAEAVGNVNFNEDTLHLLADVQVKGVAQTLQFMSGKTLQVEASGTFDNYSWRLKNMGGAIDIAVDGFEAIRKALRGEDERESDETMDKIRGAAEFLKGLGGFKKDE